MTTTETTTKYAFDGSFDDFIEKSHSIRVVVDFYTDWCGPCLELSPTLEEGAALKHYLLLKINCDDDCEGLADRFNVEGLPKVIVFENGKEISEKGFMGGKKEKALALRN